MSDKVFTVSGEMGIRVDKFLSEQIPDKSRSFISSLINDGNALVNGNVISKSYLLKNGDCVSVSIPEAVEYSAKA